MVMGTALHEPHKLSHSGFGIAAFGIALLAGSGLLVAFSWPDPNGLDLNRIFLGKVMVACGLLEASAFTLAGTALTDMRHKTMFPIAALVLAGGTLALVIAGLFGD
jgi:hypothetical protein